MNWSSAVRHELSLISSLEHSWEVAAIAYTLGLIKNRYLLIKSTPRPRCMVEAFLRLKAGYFQLR
jgi:5'-deoxynucleotidase YfbR-like HD superfamily hydrolase